MPLPDQPARWPASRLPFAGQISAVSGVRLLMDNTSSDTGGRLRHSTRQHDVAENRFSGACMRVGVLVVGF